MKSKLKLISSNFAISNYFKSFNKYHYNLYYFYDDFIKYFLSKLIKNGKKEFVYRIFLKILYFIRHISRGVSPIFIIRQGIYNCRSLISLKKVYKSKKVLFQPILYSIDKQIKRSISLIIEFSSQLQMDEVRSLFYQQLSLAFINCFLKIGPIFRKIYQMYKYISYRVDKKKLQLVQTPRFMTIFLKQGPRRKKEKGFFLRNKYSLPYWIHKV